MQENEIMIPLNVARQGKEAVNAYVEEKIIKKELEEEVKKAKQKMIKFTKGLIYDLKRAVRIKNYRDMMAHVSNASYTLNTYYEFIHKNDKGRTKN